MAPSGWTISNAGISHSLVPRCQLSTKFCENLLSNFP